MKKLICLIFLVTVFLCFAEESKSEKWTPELVQLDEMKVVGLQSYMSSKFNLVENLLNQFTERLNEVEYQKFDSSYVGISYDPKVVSNDSKNMEYHYFYLVGIPVNKIKKLPEGMCWKSVPAGLYAKFTFTGKLENIGIIYDYIFMEWLPNSGYEYDTDKIDMEWYDKGFKKENENSKIYVYIPLVDNKK